MKDNVLIIEDDRELSEHLTELLIQAGYKTQSSETGAKAIKLLQSEYEPDLVLLDLVLPDITGQSLCKEIKKNNPSIPVIILTSKSAISDVVEGFNLGADDYVTKPFSPEELLARISARIRGGMGSQSIITVGDITIDTSKISVERGKKQISLTKHEFKLLEYLAQNKDKVLSREMILNKVWEFPLEIESRVVDVYIGYLRKKIDEGHKTKLIKSVRGFGYRLSED